MIIQDNHFDIDYTHTEYDDIFFDNKKTIQINRFIVKNYNISSSFDFLMKENDIVFAYIEIDPTNVDIKNSLKISGFYYCTTTSKLMNKDISQIDYSDYDDQQYEMFMDNTNFGLTQIIKIIEGKFGWGRFYEDCNLNKHATKRMKIILTKLYDEKNINFLFARNENGITGFLVFEKLNTSINAIFAGINQNNKMKGSTFWLGWHKYIFERIGIKYVKTSISLANIGVLNIYSALGYKFYQPKEDYHFFSN